MSISVDGFTTLIAARVNNGKDPPVGVWAVGGGQVDAVDKTAQTYTVWGADTPPGSQAANDRIALTASPEYRAVVRCVGQP